MSPGLILSVYICPSVRSGLRLSVFPFFALYRKKQYQIHGKLVFTTFPGFFTFPVSVSVSRSGHILPENMKNSENLRLIENKRDNA